MPQSLFFKKSLVYLFFLLNLGVIFYFWGTQPANLPFGGSVADSLIAVGRIAGLLAVFFVLTQLVLIGRVVWLEKLFGLDKLAYVHHLNGSLALGFIILHPILITFGYSIIYHKGFWQQFFGLTFHYTNLFWALISAVLFCSIVFLSMVIVKKRLKYETWNAIHLLTYLAILLAFNHQLEFGKDFSNNIFAAYWYALYAFAFGHLIFFRIIKPLWNFYEHRFQVIKVESETPEAVSIYIGGRHLGSFKFKCGQFNIYRFLNSKAWWQAHPFSISCPPNGEYIRLTAKNLGDFTSKIKETVKAGDYVLIEGPYGVFTSANCSRQKVLLIAGGVGITPLRPLAEDFAKQNKDVVLLYANRAEQGLIFEKEIKELARNTNFKSHLILSKRGNGIYQGRLNQEMIKELVPDYQEREAYVCGPAGLTQAMLGELKKLSLPPSLIHWEKFSLS